MRYYPAPATDLNLQAVNDAINEAFAEHARGAIQMPPKVYIDLPAGDFRTMPAYIPSLRIAGVKIVNVHPDNRDQGLPTVMALTILLDVATGYPSAILNATMLTDLRTAGAGAVAARYLAPKRSVTLGLIGSGRQAQAQVRATALECDIEQIKVWSRDMSNAEKLCHLFPEFDCTPVTAEQACDCDLLVTTTPSRVPVVENDWISAGTHINAIGADAAGKEELDPAILSRATVIVDDPVQAIHSGEINVPIKKGLFAPDTIAGILGEYVLGKKKRNNQDEITIFDSTGLAIQDLAIAKIAIENENWTELPFP